MYSSFDGANFTELKPETTFQHAFPGNSLGKYEEMPFVTGGFNNKTEILSKSKSGEQLEWKTLADYPFHDGYDSL